MADETMTAPYYALVADVGQRSGAEVGPFGHFARAGSG